jgi:hypothetical protein
MRPRSISPVFALQARGVQLSRAQQTANVVCMKRRHRTAILPRSAENNTQFIVVSHIRVANESDSGRRDLAGQNARFVLEQPTLNIFRA